MDHMMSGDLSCDGHLETGSFWRDFRDLIVNLCDEVAIATREKPILEIVNFTIISLLLWIQLTASSSTKNRT